VKVVWSRLAILPFQYFSHLSHTTIQQLSDKTEYFMNLYSCFTNTSNSRRKPSSSIWKVPSICRSRWQWWFVHSTWLGDYYLFCYLQNRFHCWQPSRHLLPLWSHLDTSRQLFRRLQRHQKLQQSPKVRCNLIATIKHEKRCSVANQDAADRVRSIKEGSKVTNRGPI
jgi:hypothetical protein